jgi:RNA polymerase sigma-32 factor
MNRAPQDPPVTGLDAYLRDIRRIPVLDREEEVRLARRYRKTGNPELAQRLVAGHLRLVVKIAREYRWASETLLDLIAEGNVGLMRAVAKFDPDRGVRLTSYAAWWIRAMILRSLVDNRRLVRVGTTRAQRRILFRLQKERRALEQLGIDPQPEALAARLGVAAHDVAELEQHIRWPEVRLDETPPSHGDGEQPRVERLLAPEDGRPDALVERGELRAVVRAAVADFERQLDARDRILFRTRWLDDEEQPSLQAVGDQFGVSRERARQLERRVLERFRTFLEERSLAA